MSTLINREAVGNVLDDLLDAAGGSIATSKLVHFIDGISECVFTDPRIKAVELLCDSLEHRGSAAWTQDELGAASAMINICNELRAILDQG